MDFQFCQLKFGALPVLQDYPSSSIQNVVAMQSNGVYKSSFFVQHKASCQPADKENLLQVVKGEELEDHGEKLVGQLGVDRHESRGGPCSQSHVALTE